MSARNPVNSSFNLKLSLLLFVLIVVASFVIHLDVAEANRKDTVADKLKQIEKQTAETNLRKSRSNLPSFDSSKVGAKPLNLRRVKPPSSGKIWYPEGSNESDLIKALDEGIDQLYALTTRYKRSKNRGELWLRLAEMYVEKARLIEYQIQSKYDKDMLAFQEKKRGRRPKLNLEPAFVYNRKAIQLYEWFLRDFPKDDKVDQALFFLGYNYFELGQVKKGEKHYLRLTKSYPKSSFVVESNFALGEYYFENEKWKNAQPFYERVVRSRRHRLYSFALYKLAWVNYKRNKTSIGLKYLEKVIAHGRSDLASGEEKKRSIHLATEAIGDLIVFYAEAGKPEKARRYFTDFLGERTVRGNLKKLATYYMDTGNKAGAVYVFKDLIEEQPLDPEAYGFQKNIVSMSKSEKGGKAFAKALSDWISRFGPGSRWWKANAKNQDILQQSHRETEELLRNYVLQQHQTAQNSRAKSAQRRAKAGYDLYFRYFTKGLKADEMHFFFGELLFDMGEFQKAGLEYNWVVQNAPESSYRGKAMLNALLALEKDLPDAKEVKKIVGQQKQAVPFPEKVSVFEKVALEYFKAQPNSENQVAIEYRIGALHYYFNHYNEALVYFEKIIKEHPKTKYAEYSANLILDIYNILGDYKGLQKAADSILSVPSLKTSDVGQQIKDIKLKADFKLAKDLEEKKDYLGSAKAYQNFSKSNPQDPLALTANYNSGVNFERAGELLLAVGAYEVVAATKSSKASSLQKDVQAYLPPLYEKLGKYRQAAEGFESYAKSHPKDPRSNEFLYNAAIIYDGLNSYQAALRNYRSYFERSKKTDRFETLFLQAKLYYRVRNYKQAIIYFDQYLNSGTTNAAGVVEAAYTLSQIHKKRRSLKYAKEWYEKTVAIQRRFRARGKDVGVSFAAEAKFELERPYFDELTAIKIPSNPKTQAQAVQKKLTTLNKLKEKMKSVVAYDDGFQIVAALNLQGKALMHMHDSLIAAPTPKGLNKEELSSYKDGIKKIADPFRDQAIETWSLAVERGMKLEAYSEDLVEATQSLGKAKSNLLQTFDFRVKSARFPDLSLTGKGGADLLNLAQGSSEAKLTEACSKILAKDETNLAALNALAVFHLRKQQYGMSRIILNRALGKHPNEKALHNNLALVYLSEGDQRSALNSFRQSLRGSSYHLGALNLSNILLPHYDFSRALDPLADAYSEVKSKLNEGQAAAINVANNYAISLMGQGRKDKAAGVFESLMAAKVRDQDVHFNYAVLLVDFLKDKKNGQKILNDLELLSKDKEILQKSRELGRRAN